MSLLYLCWMVPSISTEMRNLWICRFPYFLFQLRMSLVVCIKLPNSCIYATKLGGGGRGGGGRGESLVTINFMYDISYNLIMSATTTIGCYSICCQFTLSFFC